MGNSKVLYLVRHAKSSWKDVSVRDFDRPLNSRGEADAPFMGAKLKEKGILPDLIISSPALRAITTANILAEQMGLPVSQIRTEPRVYEALSSELLELVQECDPQLGSICLVGHNPAMTGFANQLSNAGIDNMPTCSICCIEFSLADWSQVSQDRGKLVFFDYPKRYTTK